MMNGIFLYQNHHHVVITLHFRHPMQCDDNAKMMDTFIISEIGINHNGSVDIAKEMIDVAVEARVDFVKFQTFKAETLVTHSADKAEYQKNLTEKSESQFDMIKKLELDRTSHEKLIRYCKQKKIQKSKKIVTAVSHIFGRGGGGGGWVGPERASSEWTSERVISECVSERASERASE